MSIKRTVNPSVETRLDELEQQMAFLSRAAAIDAQNLATATKRLFAVEAQATVLERRLWEMEQAVYRALPVIPIGQPSAVPRVEG